MRFFIPVVFVLLYMAGPAEAINFAAGAKAPEGLIVNLYPYWFSADTRTNRDGKAVTNSLGLNKYGMLIGASYYTGDWLLNMVVPTGNLEVRSLKGESGGIGDIQLRTGYFLPVKSIAVLPVLFLKTPSGNFDKKQPVNFGDGQTDLAAELYLSTLIDRISIDALLKYSVRLRNPDSDVTPGNEFTTEWLTTWKFTDNFRAGPALNFTIGDDLKRGGKIIVDSGVMKLAVGGEVYYRGFPAAKLSLAAYQDVATRNTTEGTLVLSRIVIPF